MSVDNRVKHAAADRQKLLHLATCGTAAGIKKHSGTDFGAIGLQLFEAEGQQVRLRAFQVCLNSAWNCWEAHTLFDIECPLLLVARTKDLLLNVLAHFHALTALVKKQEERFVDQSEPLQMNGMANAVAAASAVDSAATASGVAAAATPDRASRPHPPTDHLNTGGKKHPLIPPTEHLRAAYRQQCVGAPAGSVRRCLSGRYTLARCAPIDGTFGSVYRAFSSAPGQQQQFAVKVQRSSERHSRELHVLHALRSLPCVVALVDFFECSAGYVLVVPWLEQMD